jgi:hypothetical protein
VTTPSNVRNIVIKLKGGSTEQVAINNTGNEVFLRGNLKILGGDGQHGFEIQRLAIGKNLTVINGQGFDDLNLFGVRVHGNVFVDNGSGGSETDIERHYDTASSGIGGNLVIHNGDGADYTTIEDTSIGGNVGIRNGLPDVNGITGRVAIYNVFNATTQSIIRGNVSVRYQAGKVISDGMWDTQVLGNAQFHYGSGSGQLFFDGDLVDRPVHIHGSLTVAGAGAHELYLGSDAGHGLIVNRNLTISGGVGNDFILAFRLEVGGATRIFTGDGSDAIWIDDSSFAGPTTIRTGAGADDVRFEGGLGGPSHTQFHKALQVSMGSDNDSLTLGLASFDTHVVELLAQAHLDGGAGDNDLVEWFHLLPVFEVPDLTGFEVIDD